MIPRAPLTPPYLFDTNIVIDIGERLYPPDVFPGLWEQLEAAMTAGEILIGSVVLQEMRRVTNQPWRNRIYPACTPHAVDVSRAEVQVIFGRLSGEVTARRLSAKLSDNDLLLLSCAEADRVPIVTRDAAMEAACSRRIVAAQRIELLMYFDPMAGNSKYRFYQITQRALTAAKRNLLR